MTERSTAGVARGLDPERLGLARVGARHIASLRAQLGDDAVLSERDQLAAYAHDETESLVFPPDVVVRPDSVAGVEAVLRLAHAERLPVVPRGAGTGLSGGALAVCGGIALSLERLNRIRAIDDRDLVAEVEVGVTTAALQDAVEARGLFYPPDPSSRETCQLGGNLAEDSAGPRSLRYGTTRRWVLGLEAVLADGRRISTGGRNRKDATGYSLTQLLVGSEGTLAVLTAATVALIARPAAILTLILPFSRLEDAAAAVERILGSGFDVAACELMEEAALAAVGRVEALPAPLVGKAAMLLLELHGGSSDALLEVAAGIEQVARDAGGAEAIVADDAAGQRRLWQVRRKVGEAVKGISPYKEADTVVPRSKLVDLVVAARAAARRHGLTAICYGHAGDGNLHVNLLRGDLPEEVWNERRDAAEEELFRAVRSVGGQITGEHGVGWVQRRFLPLALGDAEIALSRAVKAAFDPLGILNPGKIFPDDVGAGP